MAQILFKNAHLLDPDSDALQGGVSVLVEGGLIREVSPKAITAPNLGSRSRRNTACRRA